MTTEVLRAWSARGQTMELAGHRIFVVDIPAHQEDAEPLFVLHGFPTSSLDFHLIADRFSARRRVVLLDMLGYGLSAKPDIPYRLDLQADVVMACTDQLGIKELALLTHDMGDTVGGELLARQTEGRWNVDVRRRVLSNGSIYIEMAHLTDGQQFLLSLPDERLSGSPIDGTSMAASLAATLSPTHSVDQAELAAAWDAISETNGHLLLPRTIRYIEERRARERRYTGAIETHPSPLGVVWGVDDPIAVVAMTDRLAEARPDAGITLLDKVGHYPMLEAPDRFATAVEAYLD